MITGSNGLWKGGGGGGLANTKYETFIMVEIFSQDHFLANGDGNPIMYMLLPLGKMSKYALIFLELIKNYFCSEECTLYIHVCKHTGYTLSVVQIISYILQLQCTIGTHFNYR